MTTKTEPNTLLTFLNEVCCHISQPTTTMQELAEWLGDPHPSGLMGELLIKPNQPGFARMSLISQPDNTSQPNAVNLWLQDALALDKLVDKFGEYTQLGRRPNLLRQVLFQVDTEHSGQIVRVIADIKNGHTKQIIVQPDIRL